MQITENSVREILPGTFECINNPLNINLRQNGLEHLDTGVLSGLVNLKFVDLSQNKLQYLNPDTFLGSPNLQYLKLDDNRAFKYQMTVISLIQNLCLIFINQPAI